MAIFGSDQIKCSFVVDGHSKFGYELSHLDNEPVDEIDIGQVPWPHNWPEDKKYFSWNFIDHTPDMHASEQIKMAQVAYNSVEKICGLKIEYRPDLPRADLRTEWEEDIGTFGEKQVLAHAFLVFPQSDRNGLIQWNDSLEAGHYFTPLGWDVPAHLVDPVNHYPGEVDADGKLVMKPTQPAVHIQMHEIGHNLIGRHDILNWESTMYPTAKRGYLNGRLRKETFWWDAKTSIPRFQSQFGFPPVWSWDRLARWRAYRTLRHIYERKIPK